MTSRAAGFARSESEASVPTLYKIEHVSKEFGHPSTLLRGRSTLVNALDDVNLEIERGEALGLVGESGSGKTTLGRLLVRFEHPTRGRILMDGVDIGSLRGQELAEFRRRVQLIYQNPFSSLNPRRTVREALSSGYKIQRLKRGPAREAALVGLLERVGLHAAMLDRYPHEFSGGQRQRIVIARALSVDPSVLVGDEPVSSLDVSIQAQVLNLLGVLKRDLSLTTVMITHDLRVANFYCDRIAMLYRGRIVELGDRAVVLERSLHPYTRMLISAAPSADPNVHVGRSLVQDEVRLGLASRAGCVFSDRCWLRNQLGEPDRCTTERPPLRTMDSGHTVACHYAEQLSETAREQDKPVRRLHTRASSSSTLSSDPGHPR